MADKRTDIIFRFGLVYAVFVVLFALVIVKAAKVMTVERNGWLELHAKTSGEKQDVVEPPPSAATSMRATGGSWPAPCPRTACTWTCGWNI